MFQFFIFKGLVCFFYLLIDLCFFGWGIVTGKDFEGDREAYTSAEWKERVEKWKVRQEKKGLVSKDDGNTDQGDDDEYL